MKDEICSENCKDLQYEAQSKERSQLCVSKSIRNMYANLGKILFGSIPDCETMGNVSKPLDLDCSRKRKGKCELWQTGILPQSLNAALLVNLTSISKRLSNT